MHGIADRMRRGDYQGALAALLPAVQGPDAGPRVFEYTVLCFEALRDHATATALIDAALTRFPADVWLWTLQGRLQMQAGDAEAARRSLAKALDIAPGHLGALTTLNLIAPFAKGSREDKRLRRAVKAPGHSARELAAAHSGLARIEEAAGNPTGAFFHFTRCNRLRGGGYDPAQDRENLAAQAGLPCPAPAPAQILFVGGMPRSGTSVLDAALARHPQIASLGETPALATLFARAGTLAPTLADLTEAHRLDLRAELLSLYDPARGGAAVIIDKMPLGCLYSGFAAWLLPEARFVHMVRHPLDCGLSNFAANFDEAHGWSTRLDRIAAKWQVTQEAADLWARRLGPAFRRQSFRSLVSAPETELRAVLDHIGLPWNDACLTPEQAGPQRTASLMQVRAGFNRKGLGKWRAYQAQLAPLIEALGGPEAIAAWEAEDAPAPSLAAE